MIDASSKATRSTTSSPSSSNALAWWKVKKASASTVARSSPASRSMMRKRLPRSGFHS